MTDLVWRTLLITLMLVPLSFGSFRPWSWSLIGIIISFLSIAWIGLAGSGRVRVFWRPWLWPPAVMFTGVVMWILVQIAWPAPAAFAHPVWDLAATTLGSATPRRISADPEAGYAALIRLLSAGLIFWLALQFARTRERAVEFVFWFGLLSAAIAFYGLANFIAGNEYLLFYKRWAYLDDVTGTFVNRNTYATFAGLGLLALTVLFIDAYRRAWREADPALSWLGRRQRALSGWPATFLVGAIIDTMALLQTHSRMGLLSSLVAFLALLTLLIFSGQLRGRGAVVVIAILATGALYASGGDMLHRIASGDGSDRPQLLALTWSVICTAPLIGSGYGTFASVFPMYRDMTLPTPVSYDMAHSTYLELAMEIGIPAALLMVLSLAWLIVIAGVGVFRRERDRSLPALAVAAAVLVATHSTLDFSAQIPGVQYIFMALLGVGVAQAFPTSPVKTQRGPHEQPLSPT